MDYIKKSFQKVGLVSLLQSVFFAILGIILVCYPDITMKVISGLFGLIFIIIGVIEITCYFKDGGTKDIFNHNLIYGIMSIMMGIVASIFINVMDSVFRIIMGVWILYSALIRIKSSIVLSRSNNKSWIFSLILALIIFVCGIYVILTPNVVIKTLGIMIIIYSVIDIIENIIVMKNIKDSNVGKIIMK